MERHKRFDHYDRLKALNSVCVCVYVCVCVCVSVCVFSRCGDLNLFTQSLCEDSP